MDLRAPLARALGSGSAKEGGHHWRAQRVTAIVLTPLTIWFVVSLIVMSGASYEAAVRWLSSPIVAALMLVFVVAVCYHAHLGMQVVIEDYVHTPWLKVMLLLTLQFAMLMLALVSVLAILRVVLGA
ncbi:MAG: succinate dehydrogenase, hydrophobic membrane anchor protein [Gammaproteobacteria bacterium]